MRSNPSTQLRPVAYAPKDDDVIRIWQNMDGRWTLRDATYAVFSASIVEAVDDARADLVLEFKARDDALLDQQAELEAQQTTLASQQVILQSQQDALAAQQTTMQQLIAQVAAKKSVIVLPDVTIPASSLISITAGEKTFAGLDCSGLKTTDSVIVTPKNLPVGYGIRGWSIPSNDKITLVVQVPVLTIGGSALTFAVTAFR